MALSFAKLRTCDSYQPEEKEESEEADAAIAVMVTFSKTFSAAAAATWGYMVTFSADMIMVMVKRE